MSGDQSQCKPGTLREWRKATYPPQRQYIQNAKQKQLLRDCIGHGRPE